MNEQSSFGTAEVETSACTGEVFKELRFFDIQKNSAEFFLDFASPCIYEEQEFFENSKTFWSLQ